MKKIILAVLLVVATSASSQTTLGPGDYRERTTKITGTDTNIVVFEKQNRETSQERKHREEMARIEARRAKDLAKYAAKSEAEKAKAAKAAAGGGFWQSVLFAPSPHHWNGGGNVFGAQSLGGFTTSAPNVHTHRHSSHHGGGGNVFGAQSPGGFTTSAPNNVW